MSQHHELYHYASPGKRSNKHHISGITQQQVRYLPGLELRNGTSQPPLRVVTTEQNRIYLQVAQHLAHYNLSDRLGSLSGIVDAKGSLVSRETWYPFGGSASWLTRAVTGAARKMMRYSGKERDASGLIYYGWRYYAPWRMRWLNSDPAGTVDGINLFRMVDNNPVTFRDNDGRMTNEDTQFNPVWELRFDELTNTPPSSVLPNVTYNLFDELELPPVPSSDIANGDSHTSDTLQPGPSTLTAPTDKPAANNQPLRCPDCKKLFKKATTLELHRAKARCKTQHFCPYANCKKTFPFKSKLDAHTASVHSNERSLGCQFPGCGGCFKTESALKAHVKNVHQKSKDFHCACGTSVKTAAKLAVHQSTCLPGDHNGHYECPYCHFLFDARCGRTRHMNRCAQKP